MSRVQLDTGTWSCRAGLHSPDWVGWQRVGVMEKGSWRADTERRRGAKGRPSASRWGRDAGAGPRPPMAPRGGRRVPNVGQGSAGTRARQWAQKRKWGEAGQRGRVPGSRGFVWIGKKSACFLKRSGGGKEIPASGGGEGGRLGRGDTPCKAGRSTRGPAGLRPVARSPQ